MENESNRIVRLNPDPKTGLTKKEVEFRFKQGLVHHDANVKTKSIKEIYKGNILTIFNIVNFCLALAIILCGAIKNVLFIGTAIINTIIGIYQEIRAKKTIDQLSLINESKVPVLRDGEIENLKHEELVLDDIMVLRLGSQVVCDAIVVDGTCQVNESFITGEDKPITKDKGDTILSGSFIVSGTCKAKINCIGDDTYTSKISKDAKYIKPVNSQIMISLNRVITIISFIIIPLGVALFINQMNVPGNNFNSAVINTCAALIGMIPEGLILLTSTVLAVAVIRLGKYKVLVQELYCIETLARVDVLCLDKTGTITEGVMEVKDLISEKKYDNKEVKLILNRLCHTIDDVSPTMQAIRNEYETEDEKEFDAKKIQMFSSETKYSSVELEDCTYYLGAPDFVIKNNKEDYSEYEKDYRVLLLAKETNNKKDPMAIILIQDKIRAEAKDTLKYFKEQGVEIKIISGDNPITVSQIAKRVGVEDYDKYVDFSTINTKEEMIEAYKNNIIFGRVKPQQKKDLVLLIKELGHTVAMTGDGVNDVLALKEADCSIAMASGSDAARNVSQLVLLNSNFDSMPKVVEEGRRSINNVQRSASLFLTKTMYTMLISISLLFFSYNYPFLPIHLSLMNLITIGAPSFVLALEPNHDRVKGNFLSNVIVKALPTALTVFSTIFIMMILGSELMLDTNVISTMAVILGTIIMFTLQYRISTPFNFTRKLLFGTMTFIFLIELTYFRDFFSLANLEMLSIVLLITMLLSTFTLLKIYNGMLDGIGKFITKIKNRPKKVRASE